MAENQDGTRGPRARVFSFGRKEMATLSVTMPNYNDSQYITRSLEAVLAQSRPADEVIVIDDGSTDESLEIIKDFASRYKNLRYLQNERNRGVVYTVNRGIQAATGDYIYMGSSNDLALPGFFEKCMRAVEEHEQAGMAFTDQSAYDEKLDVFRQRPFDWAADLRFFSPEELAAIIRKKGGVIGGYSTIYRRDLALKVGLQQEVMRWYADLVMLTDIAFRAGIVYIPEGLTALRIQDSSYVAQGSNNTKIERDVLAEMILYFQAPERKDLLPYLRRSKYFSHIGVRIGPNLFGAWLSDSRIRNGRVFRFIAPMLPRAARQYFKRHFFRFIYLLSPGWLWSLFKNIARKFGLRYNF